MIAEDRYVVLYEKKDRHTTARQITNQILGTLSNQISPQQYYNWAFTTRRTNCGRPFVCVPFSRVHRGTCAMVSPTSESYRYYNYHIGFFSVYFLYHKHYQSQTRSFVAYDEKTDKNLLLSIHKYCQSKSSLMLTIQLKMCATVNYW